MDMFWDTASREHAETKLRSLSGDVNTFLAQFRSLAEQAQYVLDVKHKSLKIPTLLQSSHRKAGKEVLIDSGATDNFISTKVLKYMKIGSLKLPKPRTI